MKMRLSMPNNKSSHFLRSSCDHHAAKYEDLYSNRMRTTPEQRRTRLECVWLICQCLTWIFGSVNMDCCFRLPKKRQNNMPDRSVSRTSSTRTKCSRVSFCSESTCSAHSRRCCRSRPLDHSSRSYLLQMACFRDC